MNLWGDKPYHSLDWELKKRFGQKVYRLALNGGTTCPNRDGTVGTGGCIFCSEGGSGDFAGRAALSVPRQMEEQKKLLSSKRPANLYIAYFQAYTATYAPVDYLRKIFTQAIEQPETAVLSVATRPDCLPEECLDLLAELNQIKPVWVELGLQTIHERTAERIRRGYPLQVFEESFRKLKESGLTVIVHVIFGLPGETKEDMLATVKYLAGVFDEYKCGKTELAGPEATAAAPGSSAVHGSSAAPPQCFDGVKLQMLQILKGTEMAEEYLREPFPLFSLEEYTELVKESVRLLPADLVLHRMTGDGPKRLLIAPLWCADKKRTLNYMNRVLGDDLKGSDTKD